MKKLDVSRTSSRFELICGTTDTGSGRVDYDVIADDSSSSDLNTIVTIVNDEISFGKIDSIVVV